MKIRLCFPLVGFWLFSLVMVGSISAQSYVNFEGKLTRPITLSPDGRLLFAVNTADARLSVFDVSNPLNPILTAEIPVGVEPVSVNARNNDEVWVVNEVSDSVSVVSVSGRKVIDTLFVKDEPADVIFANGRAFVTASRNNRLAVFDAASRVLITNLALIGENPRALAASSTGDRVYVAFTLSGNRTTIVPADRAPAPPTPANPNLPPAPQVGLIVDGADPAWSGGANPVIRYTMPDNDVAEIDTFSLSVLRYFQRVGTVNFGLALRPGANELYVANTEARNLTRFEPALRGTFVTNRVTRVLLSDGSKTNFDLNPGFSTNNFPNLRDKTNALAQPVALVFGPSGSHYYVAAYGSDRVAKVDAASGAVQQRIELCPTATGSAADPRNKRGPRGLALKPGEAIYVLNRISGTISVIDLPANLVAREIPIGSVDPTPPVIRQGRGFLYDAKLSGNGTVSCASCHIDAEMDLIAWDLGDPSGVLVTNVTQLFPGAPPTTSVVHPMKGPMTTQTLRGLNGLDPLHWRGDRTNFLHFNGAFDSLLGGSTLSSIDMQEYRQFINTIVFQPNPNQNLDRTLPSTFPNGGNPQAGLTNYTVDQYTFGLTCNTCHALPTGTARAIIPAAALQESQDFKIPHLRNIYQKLNLTHAVGGSSVGGFGITHDGMDPDLFTFLSRPVFGIFAGNTAIKRNLEAFVQCLDTGTAPALGYARTLTSANVLSGSVSNDWNLLEAQAAALTNVDLIVTGTIAGRRHGFLYQPGPKTYRADSTNSAALTRAQLTTAVLAGDLLTISGVAPGAGARMSIDRDGNGVLDGDEPAPSLLIARSGAGNVVQWPTNFVGYVLERTEALLVTNWVTETSLRGGIGANLAVTNTADTTNRFFRLRRL